MTYMWRILANEWSLEQWAWYRLTTDWTNYLLGVIALVLIVQWHQTYRVLNNPVTALRTFEKNWARVAMIALISISTLLVIFDTCVVLIDDIEADDVSDERSQFVLVAYSLLKWVQAIVNAITLVAYTVLFVLFAKLISKNREGLGALRRQVIIFFVVMLVLLTINFILDIVFYLQFKSGQMITGLDMLRDQEKLVSICSYLHSTVEIIFNCVLLAFLIEKF